MFSAVAGSGGDGGAAAGHGAGGCGVGINGSGVAVPNPSSSWEESVMRVIRLAGQGDSDAAQALFRVKHGVKLLNLVDTTDTLRPLPEAVHLRDKDPNARIIYFGHHYLPESEATSPSSGDLVIECE